MRHGSTPLDGVAAGKAIMPNFDAMLHNYYSLMGWDEKGVPTPETLKNLDLENVISDLWG
jgi:aldehyde:ferredoxin oxidoreductase